MLVGGRWSGPLQSELFIEISFLSAQFALNSPKFIIHLLPSPYIWFGPRLMLSIYTWCLCCVCLILSFSPSPLPLSGRIILNVWACCSETSLRPTLSLQEKNTTNHVKYYWLPVSALLHYSLHNTDRSFITRHSEDCISHKRFSHFLKVST